MVNSIKQELPLHPGDWEYDKSYACRCHTCNEVYHGPKRSGTCWNCASEQIKTWWMACNQTDPEEVKKTLVLPPSLQSE